MSPEAGTKEHLGHRELALRGTIAKYEQPLLTGLWNRWGGQTLKNGQRKRGWLVCGPGTIALSRLINWETGIPILKDGDPNTQEHLRLSRTYFYDPPGGEIQDRIDHEFLTYFNGKSQAMHIDLTGPLTWGEKKHLTGEDELRSAIHMQKFPVADYEDALRNIYHLYPFDPTSELVRRVFEYYQQPLPAADAQDAWFTARNSDTITKAIPFSIITGKPNWDTYERYGLHLAEFIRTFLPQWNGIK